MSRNERSKGTQGNVRMIWKATQRPGYKDKDTLTPQGKQASTACRSAVERSHTSARSHVWLSLGCHCRRDLAFSPQGWGKKQNSSVLKALALGEAMGKLQVPHTASCGLYQFLSHEAKGAKTLSSDTSDQVHEPHLKVGGLLRQKKNHIRFVFYLCEWQGTFSKQVVKLGVVVHTHNTSIQEIEARGLP